MNLDPRRLCQIEIPVSDVRRSLVFYRDAFGWEPVPAEIHELVVLEVPEGCSFGISLIPAAFKGERPQSPALTLYFSTPDPKGIVRRVEAAGGRLRFGPKKVAGYGLVYQVEDPDGTRFGLYEAIAQQMP